MAVLITGSNKGIGLEIARLFAGANYPDPIIITSRNVELGQATLKKLQSDFPSARFHLHQLDLVDVASRKAMVDWVRDTFGTIKVLVNNAGFAYKAASTVAFPEQAVNTLAINFYATKDFTNEMAALISERIVTVASFVSGFAFNGSGEEVQNICKAGTATEAEITALADEFVKLAQTEQHQPKFANSSYTMSKLLIRLMTEAQAKKWPHLKVYSGDPGWCKSDMAGWEKPPKSAHAGADNFWWLSTTDDEQVLANSGAFYSEFRQLRTWTEKCEFMTFAVPADKAIGKH